MCPIGLMSFIFCRFSCLGLFFSCEMGLLSLCASLELSLSMVSLATCNSLFAPAISIWPMPATFLLLTTMQLFAS